MFVKQFNDKTNAPEMKGLMLPVIITVYSDRKLSEFKIKELPGRCSHQARGQNPRREKAREGSHTSRFQEGRQSTQGFSLTKKQIEEIAKKKLADLNARDVEHAARIIEGTARSMGITVVG